MTPERFAKVRQLFLAARERIHSEREAFLAVECSGDDDLHQRVHELLEAEGTDGEFLATPALGQSFDLRSLVGDSDATDPLIGRRLGKYLVKAVIASGGMGKVYEAEQDQPHRTVAVKIIRRNLSSRTALNRFIQEAEVLAKLSHPGIAQVYEAGRHHDADGDVPFFAMEFVENARTILDHATKANLDRRARLELFAVVCDAIQHAHQRGVIHRDIKPSNILIDAEGHPKIIDFGVACATEQDLRVTAIQATGAGFVGTPLYMSPEQFTDPSGIDTRGDVYSLGVVLYELLCGRLPYEFATDSVIEVARVVGHVEPARPSAVDRALRGDLEVILLKALAKDRSQRYQSASELADDVRLFLAGEPIRAHPPTMSYRVARFVSRRRWQVATAASACLIAGIGAAAMFVVRAAHVAADAATAESKAVEYGAIMGAAEHSLRANQVSTARALIDRYEAEAGPYWEWRHLHDRLDMSVARIPLQGRVAALACSPDGKWLAISDDRGGDGGDLVLWSVNERTLEATPGPTMFRARAAGKRNQQGQLVHAMAVAFDSSGSRLATGLGNGEILIWNRGSGEWREGLVPQVYMWFDTACHWLAFCPSDDDVLGVVGAGAQDDRPDAGSQCARLVRISTDQIIAALPGSQLGSIENLAFSPKRDTPRVVVTDYNGDFSSRVYDVSDPARPVPTAIVRGHAFHVWGAAFSPGGKVLATCSMDKSICLWDVGASELQYTSEGTSSSGVRLDTLRGHSAGVAAVAFTGTTGWRLASSGGDSSARLWQLRTLTAADGLPADSTGSSSSTLKVEQWGDPSVLRGHREEIRHLVASPDGRWIATGSSDRTVRLWMSQPVEDVPTLSLHGSSVSGVAFNQKGDMLASCSAGDVVLWDPKWTSPIARMLHSTGPDNRHVQSVAFHPSKMLLASAGENGVAKLWDTSSPRSPTEVQRLDAGAALNSVAFCADALACAGDDGVVRRWKLDGSPGVPLVSLADLNDLAGQPIESLDYSADGRWLAAGAGSPHQSGREGSHVVAVWDLKSPGSPARILSGHRGQVRCVRFSPDGTRLASASADNGIILWSVGAWKPMRLPEGHTDEVWSLAFHPTQPRLASGSADTTIRIWDLIRLTETATLRGHAATILGLAFSPDGSRLASCSQGYLGTDNDVKLWETGVDFNLRRDRADRDARLRQLAVWVLQNAASGVSTDAVRERAASEGLGLDIADVAALAVRKLNEDSWFVASKPGQAPAEYQAAVNRARLAHELAPQEWPVLNTYGVALYRVGQYEQAWQTLTRSDAMYSRGDAAHHDASDAAFLAMTAWQLGRKDDARAWLVQLRAILSKVTDAEATAFLNEATSLIEG